MFKKENAEMVIKWIGVLIALGGFLWGVTNFMLTARIQAEARRLEARKVFLDRQLKLYTEATQVAATMATTTDAEKLAKAEERFWELYWGELSMVENRAVEGAMVGIRNCLASNCTQADLQQKALALAKACRDSLNQSWGIGDWINAPAQ
jgi:hypothetical protein